MSEIGGRSGWLALAFGLGTTYQQLRTLAGRVGAIERHGSPATAVLTERVEAVKADVMEIKTAVGEIREALVAAGAARGWRGLTLRHRAFRALCHALW